MGETGPRRVAPSYERCKILDASTRTESREGVIKVHRIGKPRGDPFGITTRGVFANDACRSPRTRRRPARAGRAGLALLDSGKWKTMAGRAV